MVISMGINHFKALEALENQFFLSRHCRLRHPDPPGDAVERVGCATPRRFPGWTVKDGGAVDG